MKKNKNPLVYSTKSPLVIMNHRTKKYGFYFIYSLGVQGEGGGMSGRKEVTEVKKRNE